MWWERDTHSQRAGQHLVCTQNITTACPSWAKRSLNPWRSPGTSLWCWAPFCTLAMSRGEEDKEPQLPPPVPHCSWGCANVDEGTRIVNNPRAGLNKGSFHSKGTCAAQGGWDCVSPAYLQAPAAPAAAAAPGTPWRSPPAPGQLARSPGLPR